MRRQAACDLIALRRVRAKLEPELTGLFQNGGRDAPNGARGNRNVDGSRTKIPDARIKENLFSAAPLDSLHSLGRSLSVVLWGAQHIRGNKTNYRSVRPIDAESTRRNKMWKMKEEFHFFRPLRLPVCV